MSQVHRLDLLNNSISYFRQAVSCAQSDPADTDQWKFAIVHVVQAMELAFKEYLRRIHPAFIWESVDRADRTVSLKGALSRLRNKSIGNVAISDIDKGKIEKAFELRNELTHYEFNHENEHIEAKFSEVFSFMIFFYRSKLELKTELFIDEVQHQRIIEIVRARSELLERAKEHLRSGDFGDVWICPSCSESTFVLEEEQCCFCHHKEAIVECRSCGQTTFKSETVDTTELFDWVFDEGRVTVISNFGIESSACPSCIDDLRDYVEEQRRAQYYEDMEIEARAMR